MHPKTIDWAHCAGLPKQIWLASKSPRRLELLQILGLNVQLILPVCDQQAEQLETPLPQENPLCYVQRVTQLKLAKAQQQLQANHCAGLVLAADTTVALNENILGKPTSIAQAQHMLRSLSGQTHQVHTAVAVADLTTHALLMQVHTAQVQFAEIPETFIQSYVDSGEPFDKAGGYGIQGSIAQFIFNINGSHSGIMGLPLYETSNLIRTLFKKTAQ